MGLRPLGVVLMVLLVPTTARANDHVASIFGAFSMLSGSTHSGGQGTLEVSWPTQHNIHHYMAVLVDTSVHGGTDDAGNTVTKATILIGLRGLYRIPNQRLVVFAHGLVGGHRSQIAATADNGWAGGAGGGFDVLIGNTTLSGFALRNQYDWVRVAGENSLRVSIGFAYRFM